MDMRTTILNAAETRIRVAGFHGFSFREIAADVGIKSASVHYHFPTKADLGAAAADRYRERFLTALGDPRDDSPLLVKLDGLAALFRNALVVDGQMCLCGALGAEIDGLPPPVAEGAARFFRETLAWIEAALATEGITTSRRLAVQILALLEGGLLAARALDDAAAFEDAAGAIGTLTQPVRFDL